MFIYLVEPFLCILASHSVSQNMQLFRKEKIWRVNKLKDTIKLCNWKKNKSIKRKKQNRTPHAQSRLIRMKLNLLGILGQLPKGFRETLILIWTLMEIPKIGVSWVVWWANRSSFGVQMCYDIISCSSSNQHCTP